jgi:predicted acetyltransferase
VPGLSPPTTRVAASFVEAMAEFQAEGRGGADDASMIGQDIRTFGGRWSTTRGFAAYVAWLRSQARESNPRPEGIVASTTLWWVESDMYLGRIAIRHRLTPALAQVGGHIGYDVRPTARNRGHAGAMLRAALPVAACLGVGSALLTCAAGNVISRRVIEGCGATFAGEHAGILRFWLPTAPTVHSGLPGQSRGPG